MRELETSLQQFGEFLLKARLVKERSAPFFVRHVRQFLTRPATGEPLTDRVQQFCEDLERSGAQDWQVQQANQAIRIYFVNFLKRTDWHVTRAGALIDPDGRVDPLNVLEALRARIRTRHYSYRTECSYVDWVRRLLEYAADQQAAVRPRIGADTVRDFLTHLAVKRGVSASTQNQAMCAALFLCREVLGLALDGLAQTPKQNADSTSPSS